jgi:hypothetical protein
MLQGNSKPYGHSGGYGHREGQSVSGGVPHCSYQKPIATGHSLTDGNLLFFP